MTSPALRSGQSPQASWHVPDSPIDVSIPYRPRERGAARHFGFFPFFSKKPWQVVQEYIRHYSAPGELVCDPFAGSGVTPVEALVLGRRAVASDINPVARFIARTTAVAPVDLDALQRAYEAVRARAQSVIEGLEALPEGEILALLANLRYPREPIPPGVRRKGADTVDELHTPRQLAGLALLRDAIDLIDAEEARDLLRVALANTVRYANRMYILPYDRNGQRRSPYRGDASFLRRSSYSLASEELFYKLAVWPTFERTIEGVREAKEETNRLIGARYNPAAFTLHGVPAWRIHEVIGEGMIDYCFTDPPYSNDIRFMELSTLWAAWLELPISEEARQDELLIDTRQGKSRALFEMNFAAAVASIARALKDERWFTLVYKHRDLSLWQNIVAACEESGLRFVNAVWQDVRIPSTRQNESPNINPRGDMYLNFRKMAQQRFEAIYPQARMLDLPTWTNYIEREVERLIVAYLGADIDLIASTVIRKVLESRAFRTQRRNPKAVEADLQAVLTGSHFATWERPGRPPLWLLASTVMPDPSLDAVDRARYTIFAYLLGKESRGEVATEGEVQQQLLTQLAVERSSSPVAIDARALLSSVGREVAPHQWQLDLGRVDEYKQLRLLFHPSRADALRAQLERLGHPADPPLRPDLEGLARLRDQLRAANATNPDFDSQYAHLLTVLQTALLRLEIEFGDRVERVLAAGEWAEEGIDLRNLPYVDARIDIVVRGSERPFEFYWQVAETVFTDLRDDDILVQFRLITTPEWQRAVVAGRDQALGVSLLSRR